MLRLTPFSVHHPTSAQQAVQLHKELEETRYIAGGTDILPNIKHGLLAPPNLISLKNVSELQGLHRDEDGSIWIGASTTLHDLSEHPIVRESLPALANAAASIAGPQHRRMGTVGGNIMLDTRCLFYNQSAQWRHALGYCLKAEGDWCHVIGSKATCVAANSADTVPVFLSVGAELQLMTEAGTTRLSLDELYNQNGLSLIHI